MLSLEKTFFDEFIIQHLILNISLSGVNGLNGVVSGTKSKGILITVVITIPTYIYLLLKVFIEFRSNFALSISKIAGSNVNKISIIYKLHLK